LIRVVGVDLHVRGVDLLDGTPILDIKPYVPYADAFPASRAGWIDELSPDERQFAKRPPVR
jgi:tRNA (Thr-GGU) A37 N-methylase